MREVRKKPVKTVKTSAKHLEKTVKFPKKKRDVLCQSKQAY